MTANMARCRTMLKHASPVAVPHLLSEAVRLQRGRNGGQPAGKGPDMKVRDILAAKGSRIVTVWPSKILDRVLKMFDERGIASAVVVDADGRPVGIVTDRGALLRSLATVPRRSPSRPRT